MEKRFSLNQRRVRHLENENLENLVKEMEYIKGMLPAFLLLMIVDWILACEIKKKEKQKHK